MAEKQKKQKIFDNLFNMAYEPVVVDKNPCTDSNKKQFTTIFNALNNAQQHIMIKINPGIYNERFQIKKKDLKIQAYQISQNSIIINKEYPNIIVDLPDSNDKIMLESLKLVNVCQNNSRHEVINKNYQLIKKHDYFGFRTKTSINCCLYIKRGIVQVDQCKISMAAYHKKHITLPCIVVEKNGCLILNRSEIRGGAGTIGIFSRGGKIIIKQSIIRDHGGAGILFCSKNNSHNLIVKNSTFINCNESLVMSGPFQSLLENNTIVQSGYAGVVLYNGNKSKIINNQISSCLIGIQIKNSYAEVLKNVISSNSQWGIKIKSSNGLLCRPNIKFNTINQNSQGGILIQGSLNNSCILNNELNYNNKYGIKIANRATPHIFMNKIHRTLGNGIEISKGCSAFVEKNQIQASLKCNLVIEGPDNIDNFIFGNTISKARGEGIFCIFGQKFTIKDNIITQNYNGIVSLTGVENIQENSICSNERNGILLIKDNHVSITGNQIQNNKKAGIFIRDSSVGKIQQNLFSKNRIEIVIENDDSIFHNIQEDNVFEGDYDIRVPKNYKCQLI